MKILLVEPNYRSTFPPLGLLRISAFFKSIGVIPKFIRGNDKDVSKEKWDKIYISTLFTFELPRTVKTIEFYTNSVINPSEDIIVGGIGVTLLPEYVRENTKCKIITGPLDKSNILGFDEPAIATFMPDYDILKTVDYEYKPENAYFTRVSIGCIRKCGFCAVPILEPAFGYLQPLTQQVSDVARLFGEKKDLIILDNNILALDNIESVLKEIKDLGFYKGALFKKAKRIVDFNQGIDVRLITPKIAKALGGLAVEPVRIAFDHISVEKQYREGVKLLADNGIVYIMTYVMFNFKDTVEDFYHRLQVNLELSEKYNVKISGFPMRYCPIDDVNRHYVSENWNWKYLRGIQCILNATHGIVSPSPRFFKISFGNDINQFLEILSMPDDYIVYRAKNSNNAIEWKRRFNELTPTQVSHLFSLLALGRSQRGAIRNQFPEIASFYFPNTGKKKQSIDKIEN